MESACHVCHNLLQDMNGGEIEDSKKEEGKRVLKKWLLQLEWEGRRPYHFESVIILSGPCFSATAPSEECWDEVGPSPSHLKAWICAASSSGMHLHPNWKLSVHALSPSLGAFDWPDWSFPLTSLDDLSPWKHWVFLVSRIMSSQEMGKIYLCMFRNMTALMNHT